MCFEFGTKVSHMNYCTEVSRGMGNDHKTQLNTIKTKTHKTQSIVKTQFLDIALTLLSFVRSFQGPSSSSDERIPLVRLTIIVLGLLLITGLMMIVAVQILPHLLLNRPSPPTLTLCHCQTACPFASPK